jgi:hypothetical protein
MMLRLTAPQLEALTAEQIRTGEARSILIRRAVEQVYMRPDGT